MRFMNDYDLLMAQRRFGPVGEDTDTPNRLHLACVVDRLRVWADHNSDGWAYWQAPRNAARKAVELIYAPTSREIAQMTSEDATDAEVTAALRPIKAFCTRQMSAPARMTPDDRDWILGRSA